jgi:hypothetical protein
MLLAQEEACVPYGQDSMTKGTGSINGQKERELSLPLSLQPSDTLLTSEMLNKEMAASRACTP